MNALSGSVLAVQVGIPVTVLESAADPRRGGEGAAIGLWENAWCALDVLGVGDTLRKDHVRINRYASCMVQPSLVHWQTMHNKHAQL